MNKGENKTLFRISSIRTNSDWNNKAVMSRKTDTYRRLVPGSLIDLQRWLFRLQLPTSRGLLGRVKFHHRSLLNLYPVLHKRDPCSIWRPVTQIKSNFEWTCAHSVWHELIMFPHDSHFMLLWATLPSFPTGALFLYLTAGTWLNFFWWLNGFSQSCIQQRKQSMPFPSSYSNHQNPVFWQ